MKKQIAGILALLLIVSIALCGCGKKTDSPDAADSTKHSFVLFTMENGESFKVELYPEYAPKTVENFLKLVNDGFYDGLTFHRIVDDFMAQGGDPSLSGKAEAPSIKGEFAENGFAQNTLHHERGIISMARTTDPDSASSQFFICYSDTYSSSLDNKYAAFGKVVEGMETVDNFLKVQRSYNSLGELATPVTPIVIAHAQVVSGEIAVPVTDTMLPTEESTAAPAEDTTAAVDLKHSFVKFTMENGETFKVELYPEYAPKTVENFLKLVNNGFYDGLTFHRIVNDFMAQGGDPALSGKAEAPSIKGEFAANGFTQNTLHHDRGVISMARTTVPDSASSQFFICYSDTYSSSLDNNYAAFGKVVEGMETVDNFLKVERTANSLGEMATPVTPIVISNARVVEQ